MQRVACRGDQVQAWIEAKMAKVGDLSHKLAKLATVPITTVAITIIYCLLQPTEILHSYHERLVPQNGSEHPGY